MSSAYSEYIDFIEKYRDELLTALENERDKRLALLKSDLTKLEAVISLQQAQTMKLRTMEEKRISLQLTLGADDLTARELLARMAEGEEKNRLDTLVNEITELTESIRGQNVQSLELAQTNLRILESILQKSGFDEEKNIYGPGSGRRSTSTSGKTFEGKI